MIRTLLMSLTLAGVAAGAVGAQSTPVPRPFPGSAGPAASAPRPATPAPASTPSPGPTAAPAGVSQTPAAPPAAASPASRAGAPQIDVQIYPTADYLENFDAGAGQRYYLYGTNAPFADVVTYYRTVLRTSGREIYRVPAIQQFDLGRYQEETMAFPPSVVVKDYTWNNSTGYPFVSGTTEKRYRTIIQIVPPSPPVPPAAPTRR